MVLVNYKFYNGNSNSSNRTSDETPCRRGEALPGREPSLENAFRRVGLGQHFFFPSGIFRFWWDFFGGIFRNPQCFWWDFFKRAFYAKNPTIFPKNPTKFPTGGIFWPTPRPQFQAKGHARLLVICSRGSLSLLTLRLGP